MSFIERSAYDIYGSPNIYDSPTNELDPSVSGSNSESWIESSNFGVQLQSYPNCTISLADASSKIVEWATIEEVTQTIFLKDECIRNKSTSTDERCLPVSVKSCIEQSVAQSVQAIAINNPDIHYSLHNGISICISTQATSSNSISVSISPVQHHPTTTCSPASNELASPLERRNSMHCNGRCIWVLLPLVTILVILATVLNAPYLMLSTLRRRIQSSRIVGASDQRMLLGSTSATLVFSPQEDPRQGVHVNSPSSMKRAAVTSPTSPHTAVRMPIEAFTRTYSMRGCLLHVRRLLHSAASIVKWFRCIMFKQC